MRLVTAALAVAALSASAVAAVAAPVHVDDAQVLAANRCLGLMSSHTLGTPEAAALRQFIKDQSWGRVSFVYDQADALRDAAVRQAGRSDPDLRARLTAERDGVCHTFLELETTTAASRGAPRSIQ